MFYLSHVEIHKWIVQVLLKEMYKEQKDQNIQVETWTQDDKEENHLIAKVIPLRIS